MPYTLRNKIEKIDTNTQTNTWGVTESKGKDRLDESLDGILSFALSGDKSLVYSNTSTDEGHWSTFNITGGIGGRVIMQPVQGVYTVRNASTGDVDFTIDGVQLARVPAGTITQIFCDGVNSVYQIGAQGLSITKMVADAETRAKQYADTLGLSSLEGSLPGQAGPAGRVIKTNGVAAFWDFVQIEDIEGLLAELKAQRDFAIAISAII